MRKSVRNSIVLIMTIAALWLASYGWHMMRVRSLTAECLRFEKTGSWARLVRSAREWMKMEPENREARQAGVMGGRALNDVRAVTEFLEGFPRELPDDVPWLSMLADVKFGPANFPLQGVQVCQDILQITPNHKESHRRLIYYFAMTQQLVLMQKQIEAAIENRCELPEAYVYGFLGPGLRLQNGSEVTRRWLTNDSDSELLEVARALHVAQSLAGAIPSVDEATAAMLRSQQKEREVAMGQLLEKYPRNLDLRAYLLNEAMETGQARRAGELLKESPSAADEDFRFWHVRGWIFSNLNEFEEAGRCFEKAIHLAPLDWRTRFHYAEMLRRSGKVEESTRLNSVSILGRAIEKELLQQPDTGSVPKEIYGRLAEYCQQCGSDRMAQRVTDYLRQSDMAKSP